jgi:Uma2 family endonuclease
MSTPEPLAPTRHLLTVDEYFRMGTAGVLPPEARVELIDGEIIDMPPIGPPHGSRVKWLSRILHRAVGDRAIVSTQDPVVLGAHSTPQPDLALLRYKEDFYASAHPGPADVLLAIEVAETSLAYDRDTKVPLYARFGIPEVWLVDLAGRHLDIYREPDQGRYATRFRPEELAAVEIRALPGLVIDLRGLL